MEKLKKRLFSLDVFRGITIAGMILVNNPGSWKYIYPPLKHADWNGWTPTDLIFPFFLFIVGVSIAYSLSLRIERGDKKNKIFLKILTRTLILFFLGLFLHAFPNFNLSELRIPGVLQRIAICYLFASVIFLMMDKKGLILTTFGLLIIYWVLMKIVPVPGIGAGVLIPEGNLAAYIDNLVFHGHRLYRGTWDPEGILSTLPAIGTVLFGVLTGIWLSSSISSLNKTVGMLAGGSLGIILGYIMNIWFPINKNLWTSSYVVLTAGLALVFLALIYWLCDVKGVRFWAKPSIVFGMNSIAVYFLSGILSRLLSIIKITLQDSTKISIHNWIYRNFFASWAGPFNGSLFFALSYVFFWLGIMTIFYRRKIFIKI
ncbi:MAG: DUF5009 domain-containing protein [Acidobacteriota bacterium]